MAVSSWRRGGWAHARKLTRTRYDAEVNEYLYDFN